MEQMEAVQRMQDYIAQHLFEEITPADLARSAMFSPWYARRLFMHWTGLTPADYIRRLRLREAALRLKKNDCRVLDVAMELGFGSADGFTRAFQREFGCLPKDYAQNPIPLPLYTVYGVKYRQPKESEEPMSQLRNVFIKVVEKPARKVIIRRGVSATEYFAYCAEVGCDVWGILESMAQEGSEPVCLWLPEKYIRPGTSQYVQGVEVALEYDGPVPEGFDVIELPKARYLMFQGEPFAEEDYGRAIEEIWEAEKRYNPSIIGLKWDEENPRIQLAPIGTRGYIELVAVK